LFLTFLRLGLTSFGGPVAHLSYFYDEFVKRKKWLSDQTYADLVVHCQFLPGPASSQVGLAIGLYRGGLVGALVAWLAFTLPSAIFLVLMGLFFKDSVQQGHPLSWLHGLKLVAVSVVAQAVWGMAKKFCPDRSRILIAFVSSLSILSFKGVFVPIFVVTVAGIVGSVFFETKTQSFHEFQKSGLSKTFGAFALVIFAALLFLLPLWRELNPSSSIALIDSFYRAGSLVFGGGHVVLPLLQEEVIPTGWISKELFTMGYGLAQALPGPLFTFAAYLGAVSSQEPHGWLGAAVCLLAVYLPSFLLVFGGLPFWEHLRSVKKVQSAMLGIHAAVVGLLLAALYDPVWVSAVSGAKDVIYVLVGFIMLEIWCLPSWLVVALVVLISV
jgi:chromate transporter